MAIDWTNVFVSVFEREALVSVITDIKCPICRDRISARSQDELTETLRAHLADTHQISRISSEQGGMQGGMRTSSAGMMGLEGGALSRRDPSMLTPEESRQREEITRLSPSRMESGPMGSSESQHRSESWVRSTETWSGREPTGETPESSRTIQETTQWKYPQMETEEERAAGTWRAESRPGESEREYRSTERSERGYSSEGMRGEERYREGRGYGVAPSVSDVPHGGGTWHRMMHRRETMTMAMDCPLCGNPVYGSDEDDLDDELRFHFKDYHQIRRR